MHFFFMLARVYPYWSIPGIFVLGELGVFYRRKRNPLQHLFWTLIGLLGVGFIFWVIYRGDLNSDEWVRSMLN